MEINKLYEASLKGSVESLKKLLTANPRLPLDEKFTGNRRTPLHIAAMCGHVKFAQHLMSTNSDLTRKKDSHGFTPLHLASARRSKDMVEKLLEGNNQDVCTEKDQDGRTPLHLAAMKDQVEIIAVLLGKNPEAIHTRNDQNETILHLCVKHKNLKALKSLVKHLVSNGPRPGNADSISVNSRDEHGNTILHLAAETKQMQCMKYLMESKDFVIDTDVLNIDNKRARDMLKEAERDYLEIGYYKNKDKISKDWMKDRVNIIMVVATLIAGVAFAAAMNPPGGVFQDDSYINSGDSPVLFTYYLGSVADPSKYSLFQFEKYRIDPLVVRDDKMIKRDDFLKELLDTLKFNPLNEFYPYVNGRSPGMVSEHDKWNSTIFIYNLSNLNFFPYLIRYAGTPILAYRNPTLYTIYMTSIVTAFTLSISIILLVISGFIYEDSITHQIRVLATLMFASTVALFVSHIAAVISMSPPFYVNQWELVRALILCIAVMWLSVFLYPLGEYISRIRDRKKQVLIDQFRKEGVKAIGNPKQILKTVLKFLLVYGLFLVVLMTIHLWYKYTVKYI